MNNIVIGKRIQVGAAINGIALAFAAIFTDQAIVIMACVIPTTFAVQVVIANYWGVTTK